MVSSTDATRLASGALNAGAGLTAKNSNTSSEAGSFGCTGNAARTGSRNTRNGLRNAPQTPLADPSSIASVRASELAQGVAGTGFLARRIIHFQPPSM